MSSPEFRRAVSERAASCRKLLSLVTRDHPRFGGYESEPVSGWIVFVPARHVRTDLGAVWLSVEEILTGEQASVLEYKYALSDAQSGREIFAYHLHPGKISTPHFHLGAAAGVLAEPLYKAHFPTGGAVPLGELIRLIVRDLGARPLLPNWEQILDEPPEG